MFGQCQLTTHKNIDKESVLHHNGKCNNPYQRCFFERFCKTLHFSCECP